VSALIEVVRRLVIALLLALLSVWLVSALAVLIWSARDEAQPAAAVVVLGAAQYAGRPSPVLRARLDHGIELWRKNPTGLLVLTGGTGAGDTTSEAEVGRSYVRKQGVPDTMIVVENAGRTTSESMRAVAEIMRERRESTVVLVSVPHAEAVGDSEAARPDPLYVTDADEPDLSESRGAVEVHNQ
jgi:uncharacterized SAM-binding protein YcdF (DUF218 family)